MAHSLGAGSAIRAPLPREHGAYGQLGFPLAAALAIGELRLAGLAVVGAAIAAFLAHEPLLVLLGRRGERARGSLGARAGGWLAVLGSAAVALVVAAWLAAPDVRQPLGISLLLSAVVLLAAIAGREKTGWGEVLVAVALSSWAYPAAVGLGAPASHALACWVVFGAGFATATVSVRAVIASHKPGAGRGPRGRALLFAGLLLGAGAVLASSGRVPAGWALALVPIGGLSVVIAALAPHPRALKSVGWALIGACALATLLLAVMLR